MGVYVTQKKREAQAVTWSPLDYADTTAAGTGKVD